MVEYTELWFCPGAPTYNCQSTNIPAPGRYTTREECCANCLKDGSPKYCMEGHNCEPGHTYIGNICWHNFVLYGAGIGILGLAYLYVKSKKK